MQSKVPYKNSIHIQAPKVDEMLMNIIDDMWNKYDDDGSGYIDKSEFYEFLKDTMGDDLKETIIEGDLNENEHREIELMKQMGTSDNQTYLEEIYKKKLDECFEMFDINGDGILEKSEMLMVFKYLTGLD